MMVNWFAYVQQDFDQWWRMEDLVSGDDSLPLLVQQILGHTEPPQLPTDFRVPPVNVHSGTFTEDVTDLVADQAPDWLLKYLHWYLDKIAEARQPGWEACYRFHLISQALA